MKTSLGKSHCYLDEGGREGQRCRDRDTLRGKERESQEETETEREMETKRDTECALQWGSWPGDKRVSPQSGGASV